MLPLSFYAQDALTLARALLGCELVHDSTGGRTAGIIVETEAYRQDDKASHSFRGRTKRNEVMFGPGGYAYVYFTYGMHYCFNVVAGDQNFAEAVLVRALEPTDGTWLMAGRRRTSDPYNLCSGPAKLVQAMGILPHHNGIDLTAGKLYIQPHGSGPDVAISPRIGITQAAEKPWRFFVKDSPYVTKHKFNRL